MCTTNICFFIAECEQPDNIDNGNFVISDSGISVLYSCDVGYSMNGSNTRSCDSGGNGWTGSSPQCCKLPFFFDLIIVHFRFVSNQTYFTIMYNTLNFTL